MPAISEQLYYSNVRGRRLHRTYAYAGVTLCGVQRPWMTDNERATFGPGMVDCPKCAAILRKQRAA